MKTQAILFPIVMAAAALFLAGCDDSNSPLSDPEKSKADERLAGVWRHQDRHGNVTYYHIGAVGDKLPGGVMGVVTVTHTQGGKIQRPGQILVFPTTIAGKSYLNVTGGEEKHFKKIADEGWGSVGGYILLKYQVEKDALVVWPMDRQAKEQAIKAGKIPGQIDKEGPIKKTRFTGTTEELARLVADEGDALFSTKAVRMERVAPGRAAAAR